MTLRRSLQFVAVSAVTALMITLGYHTSETGVAFAAGYLTALLVLHTTE